MPPRYHNNHNSSSITLESWCSTLLSLISNYDSSNDNSSKTSNSSSSSLLISSHLQRASEIQIYSSSTTTPNHDNDEDEKIIEMIFDTARRLMTLLPPPPSADTNNNIDANNNNDIVVRLVLDTLLPKLFSEQQQQRKPCANPNTTNRDNYDASDHDKLQQKLSFLRVLIYKQYQKLLQFQLEQASTDPFVSYRISGSGSNDDDCDEQLRPLFVSSTKCIHLVLRNAMFLIASSSKNVSAVSKYLILIHRCIFQLLKLHEFVCLGADGEQQEQEQEQENPAKIVYRLSQGEEYHGFVQQQQQHHANIISDPMFLKIDEINMNNNNNNSKSSTINNSATSVETMDFALTYQRLVQCFASLVVGILPAVDHDDSKVVKSQVHIAIVENLISLTRKTVIDTDVQRKDSHINNHTNHGQQQQQQQLWNMNEFSAICDIRFCLFETYFFACDWEKARNVIFLPFQLESSSSRENGREVEEQQENDNLSALLILFLFPRIFALCKSSLLSSQIFFSPPCSSYHHHLNNEEETFSFFPSSSSEVFSLLCDCMCKIIRHFLLHSSSTSKSSSTQKNNNKTSEENNTNSTFLDDDDDNSSLQEQREQEQDHPSSLLFDQEGNTFLAENALCQMLDELLLLLSPSSSSSSTSGIIYFDLMCLEFCEKLADKNLVVVVEMDNDTSSYSAEEKNKCLDLLQQHPKFIFRCLRGLCCYRSFSVGQRQRKRQLLLFSTLSFLCSSSSCFAENEMDKFDLFICKRLLDVARLLLLPAFTSSSSASSTDFDIGSAHEILETIQVLLQTIENENEVEVVANKYDSEEETDVIDDQLQQQQQDDGDPSSNSLIFVHIKLREIILDEFIRRGETILCSSGNNNQTRRRCFLATIHQSVMLQSSSSSSSSQKATQLIKQWFLCNYDDDFHFVFSMTTRTIDVSDTDKRDTNMMSTENKQDTKEAKEEQDFFDAILVSKNFEVCTISDKLFFGDFIKHVASSMKVSNNSNSIIISHLHQLLVILSRHCLWSRITAMTTQCLIPFYHSDTAVVSSASSMNATTTVRFIFEELFPRVIQRIFSSFLSSSSGDIEIDQLGLLFETICDYLFISVSSQKDDEDDDDDEDIKHEKMLLLLQKLYSEIIIKQILPILTVMNSNHNTSNTATSTSTSTLPPLLLAQSIIFGICASVKKHNIQFTITTTTSSSSSSVISLLQDLRGVLLSSSSSTKLKLIGLMMPCACNFRDDALLRSMMMTTATTMTSSRNHHHHQSSRKSLPPLLLFLENKELLVEEVLFSNHQSSSLVRTSTCACMFDVLCLNSHQSTTTTTTTTTKLEDNIFNMPLFHELLEQQERESSLKKEKRLISRQKKHNNSKNNHDDDPQSIELTISSNNTAAGSSSQQQQQNEKQRCSSFLYIKNMEGFLTLVQLSAAKLMMMDRISNTVNVNEQQDAVAVITNFWSSNFFLSTTSTAKKEEQKVGESSINLSPNLFAEEEVMMMVHGLIELIFDIITAYMILWRHHNNNNNNNLNHRLIDLFSSSKLKTTNTNSNISLSTTTLFDVAEFLFSKVHDEIFFMKGDDEEKNKNVNGDDDDDSNGSNNSDFFFFLLPSFVLERIGSNKSSSSLVSTFLCKVLMLKFFEAASKKKISSSSSSSSSLDTLLKLSTFLRAMVTKMVRDQNNTKNLKKLISFITLFIFGDSASSSSSSFLFSIPDLIKFCFLTVGANADDEEDDSSSLLRQCFAERILGKKTVKKLLAATTATSSTTTSTVSIIIMREMILKLINDRDRDGSFKNDLLMKLVAAMKNSNNKNHINNMKNFNNIKHSSSSPETLSDDFLLIPLLASVLGQQCDVEDQINSVLVTGENDSSNNNQLLIQRFREYHSLREHDERTMGHILRDPHCKNNNKNTNRNKQQDHQQHKLSQSSSSSSSLLLLPLSNRNIININTSISSINVLEQIKRQSKERMQTWRAFDFHQKQQFFSSSSSLISSSSLVSPLHALHQLSAKFRTTMDYYYYDSGTHDSCCYSHVFTRVNNEFTLVEELSQLISEKSNNNSNNNTSLLLKAASVLNHHFTFRSNIINFIHQQQQQQQQQNNSIINNKQSRRITINRSNFVRQQLNLALTFHHHHHHEEEPNHSSSLKQSLLSFASTTFIPLVVENNFVQVLTKMRKVQDTYRNIVMGSYDNNNNNNLLAITTSIKQGNIEILDETMQMMMLMNGNNSSSHSRNGQQQQQRHFGKVMLQSLVHEVNSFSSPQLLASATTTTTIKTNKRGRPPTKNKNMSTTTMPSISHLLHHSTQSILNFCCSLCSFYLNSSNSSNNTSSHHTTMIMTKHAMFLSSLALSIWSYRGDDIIVAGHDESSTKYSSSSLGLLFAISAKRLFSLPYLDDLNKNVSSYGGNNDNDNGDRFQGRGGTNNIGRRQRIQGETSDDDADSADEEFMPSCENEEEEDTLNDLSRLLFLPSSSSSSSSGNINHPRSPAAACASLMPLPILNILLNVLLFDASLREKFPNPEYFGRNQTQRMSSSATTTTTMMTETVRNFIRSLLVESWKIVSSSSSSSVSSSSSSRTDVYFPLHLHRWFGKASTSFNAMNPWQALLVSSSNSTDQNNNNTISSVQLTLPTQTQLSKSLFDIVGSGSTTNHHHSQRVASWFALSSTPSTPSFISGNNNTNETNISMYLNDGNRVTACIRTVADQEEEENNSIEHSSFDHEENESVLFDTLEMLLPSTFSSAIKYFTFPINSSHTASLTILDDQRLSSSSSSSSSSYYVPKRPFDLRMQYNNNKNNINSHVNFRKLNSMITEMKSLDQNDDDPPKLRMELWKSYHEQICCGASSSSSSSFMNNNSNEGGEGSMRMLWNELTTMGEGTPFSHHQHLQNTSLSLLLVADLINNHNQHHKNNSLLFELKDQTVLTAPKYFQQQQSMFTTIDFKPHYQVTMMKNSTRKSRETRFHLGFGVSDALLMTTKTTSSSSLSSSSRKKETHDWNMRMLIKKKEREFDHLFSKRTFNCSVGDLIECLFPDACFLGSSSPSTSSSSSTSTTTTSSLISACVGIDPEKSANLIHTMEEFTSWL